MTKDELLLPEEVCTMIDNYPNVMPEVARLLKGEVMKGIAPHAVRVSLGVEPVTVFRRTR